MPRQRAEIAPGAVHVPGWLSTERQLELELVEACRAWARGPVPIRRTKLPNGGVMSVQTVCLGWHWQPYEYRRTADDVNGEPVQPFPGWFGDLGRAPRSPTPTRTRPRRRPGAPEHRPARDRHVISTATERHNNQHFGGTIADGTYAEVEVADATTEIARVAVQAVYDSLPWRPGHRMREPSM